MDPRSPEAHIASCRPGPRAYLPDRLACRRVSVIPSREDRPSQLRLPHPPLSVGLIVRPILRRILDYETSVARYYRRDCDAARRRRNSGYPYERTGIHRYRRPHLPRKNSSGGRRRLHRPLWHYRRTDRRTRRPGAGNRVPFSPLLYRRRSGRDQLPRRLVRGTTCPEDAHCCGRTTGGGGRIHASRFCERKDGPGASRSDCRYDPRQKRKDAAGFL